MTQKPDPDKPPTARESRRPIEPPETWIDAERLPVVDEREAQLKDLTEQCLELMDQLAEVGRERDRLRERCAEVEDELSRTQRDNLVARERTAWLEEVLSHMHRTSEHMNAQELEKLKSRALAAADAGPVADLEERFERLGRGIDLEHQLKAGLVNLVNSLKAEVARIGGEMAKISGELAKAGDELAKVGDEEKKRKRIQAELAAVRSKLAEAAASASASAAELQRIRAELEQEGSSKKDAMNQLLEANTTIRELRAILGLDDSQPREAAGEWIRRLQAKVNDRERWVAALLSELSRRRLKLTRRDLMDYERRFLQDLEQAEGS